MALAWFFRKLLQVWESLGGCLLTMYLRTVEEAWWMPNLSSNSRAMRSSPYSGWSEDIRRMNAICSLGIAGLPVLPRDFLRQNSRNFFFLHRITVSGLTRFSSEVQSLQTFESNTQNSRSRFLNRGVFIFLL